MRIPFWFRCHVYIHLWKYGLQFDVQRNIQEYPYGRSFMGNLWTWDYRSPFRLTHD